MFVKIKDIKNINCILYFNKRYKFSLVSLIFKTLKIKTGSYRLIHVYDGFSKLRHPSPTMFDLDVIQTGEARLLLRAPLAQLLPTCLFLILTKLHIIQIINIINYINKYKKFIYYKNKHI